MIHYNPESGEFTKNGKPVGTEHNGYLRFQTDGKRYLAHRYAFLVMTGEIPEVIDHINHDTSDNRWCNLRAVDRRGNLLNRPLQRNNKSGIHGVFRENKRDKWKVQVDKKHVGYFDDFFEACCARKSAEFRLGYHANHGGAS